MSGQPSSADTRALAESLVPGCWPTTDDATLGHVASGLAALRERLDHLAADLAAAFRDVDGGDGRFTHAILAGRDRLVGDEEAALPTTARAVAAAADAVEAFADLTVAARLRIELVAAITGRDQMLGELAAALGDDTHAVRAATAGRMALTAAGDEYTEQSGTLVRADPAGPGGGGHTDEGTGSSASATSGMMPMAGFAGLGAAAAGAGLGSAVRRVPAGPRTGSDGEADEPPELTRAEYDALARRAAALHMSLPGAVGSWVQIAVGVGEHPQTGRTVVIATSDPVPYLRRGMSIRSGEELVGDGRVPEIALVHHMQNSGVIPLAVASASPPSAQARAAIAASGAAQVASASRSSNGVAGQ
ncbi:hypothetical protein EF294_15905 [Gordonia oryzae]|uniref:Uncharacterized protein n=1 Tax=Gordonia oryzae TaxID=2487349 RepID=A0A3N4GAE8_9ACTN|nr:hypothetical protein [Gordonia oryzae]RPA58337.1 hypothetical protein EF294_15905 [Gordonia oryzae]